MKSSIIKIAVSPDQRQKIELAANERDMTISAYMRRMAGVEGVKSSKKIPPIASQADKAAQQASAFVVTSDQPRAKQGQIVYRCKGWDYGCANDDTRHLGVKHVSMTLDPTGDYPFFTIEERALRPATAQDLTSINTTNTAIVVDRGENGE